MIASRVTIDVLQRAAVEVGVRAEVSMSYSPLRHRVKLYPLTPAELYTPSGRRHRGEKGDARYQRTSAFAMHDDRRVHAVCWHGFRDFFRAVYRLTPGAYFYTAMATWKGSEHFEANYRASGSRNVGTQIMPMCAAEVCRCSEQGYAG